MATTLVEEWRPVLDGYYEVSNFGRVRRIRSAKGATVGQIVQPRMWGLYLSVTLYRDSRAYHVRVHKLVAEAFIGPIPRGWTVNHKDMDKLHNQDTNLEIVSFRDNCKHAWRTAKFDVSGERNHRAKLTAAQVDEIRILHQASVKQVELAKRFGVHRNTINSIVRNINWRSDVANSGIGAGD